MGEHEYAHQAASASAPAPTAGRRLRIFSDAILRPEPHCPVGFGVPARCVAGRLWVSPDVSCGRGRPVHCSVPSRVREPVSGLCRLAQQPAAAGGCPARRGRGMSALDIER